MAITFNCTCGQQLQVEDEYAGAQAQCPECNKVLPVPSAAAPAVARPSVARPVKRREPVDTDDDLGAEATSLNPYESKRKSKRRRDDDDEEDDDRPSKKSRRLVDDEDDEDYDRPRKKRKRLEEPKYKLFNNQTIGGAVLMVIPIAIELIAIVFFGSWVISVWMIVIFVAGLIAFIKGLVTGRGE